jgi:hypothetical protein
MPVIMLAVAFAGTALLAVGMWPLLALALAVEFLWVGAACLREIVRRRQIVYRDAADEALLREEAIDIARMRDLLAREPHENWP